MAMMLLDHDAIVDKANNGGCTPLYVVALVGGDVVVLQQRISIFDGLSECTNCFFFMCELTIGADVKMLEW